jgi:hypothetical protein
LARAYAIDIDEPLGKILPRDYQDDGWARRTTKRSRRFRW